MSVKKNSKMTMNPVVLEGVDKKLHKKAMRYDGPLFVVVAVRKNGIFYLDADDVEVRDQKKGLRYRDYKVAMQKRDEAQRFAINQADAVKFYIRQTS